MGQSFQAQIQQLLQAGIATHLVENPTAIDPLFALSKVRDFPEVTFAASFEDGTVVLGCPTDLPEPLMGIAQPITSTAPPPPDPIEAKLDALLAGLDELKQQESGASAADQRDDQIAVALEQLQSTQPAMQAQMTELRTALEQGLKDVSGRLADDTTVRALQPQLMQIAQAIETTADAPRVTQELSQIQNQTTEILTALASQRPGLDPQAFEAHLASLEARLTEQMAATPTPPDLSAQTEGLASSQQVMEQVLTTVSNDIKSMIAMQGAAHSQEVPCPTLPELISALEDAPKLAALDDRLDAISHSIAHLTDGGNTKTDPAIDNLSRQIDALASDVAAIAHKPVPKVDLTEQRQGMARFQTAMGTVLSRLEHAITDLGEVGQTTRNAIPGALEEQLASLSAQILTVTGLPQQLNQIEAGLAELPSHRDAILCELQNTPQRGDPSQEFVAQRRSLAHLANAIGMVVSRVEAAVDGLVQNNDRDELAPILARIETVLAETAAPKPDVEVIERVTEQGRQIGDLRAEITRLFERPPPTLDLTAQRKSFAQFGAAIATVVARFEKIAAQFEMPPVEQKDVQTSETKQEVPSSPGTSFADNRISIAQLRHEFAELIAKQIKQNTAAGTDRDPAT